jgi:hypothetical protein
VYTELPKAISASEVRHLRLPAGLIVMITKNTIAKEARIVFGGSLMLVRGSAERFRICADTFAPKKK